MKLKHIKKLYLQNDPWFLQNLMLLKYSFAESDDRRVQIENIVRLHKQYRFQERNFCVKYLLGIDQNNNIFMPKINKCIQD